LNLHPAAPGGPIGMWQDVIWQLIASRAERSGVTIFLCTTELDRGPTVTYCTYPLHGTTLDPLWRQVEGRSVEEIKAMDDEQNLLFKEIRRQGATRELPLIVATLRAFADGRLHFQRLQVVTADQRPIDGFNLTPEVEAAVAPLLA
jgi:phosphoribosylglycinamide formyltransferase-1